MNLWIARLRNKLTNARVADSSLGRKEHVFSRRNIAYSVLLIALTLASSYPRSYGPVDLRWDASTYFVLGKSLAEGKGYRLLNEPGEIKALQYPPAVPAIIAVHQLALGSDEILSVGSALKLTWIALLSIFVAASYLLLRRFLNALWSFLVAASIGLSFPVILITNTCTADLPFGVAFLLCLLTAQFRPGIKREWLTGALAVLSFFTRSLGIALLAGWVFEALLKRNLSAALSRLAVAVVCIITWGGYVASVERDKSFQSPSYPYQRASYLFYNVSYSSNVTYVDPYRPELGKLSTPQMAGRALGNLETLPRSIGEALTDYQSMWEYFAQRSTRGYIRDPVLSQVIGTLLWVLGLAALLGVLLLFRREAFMATCVLLALCGVCASPWPGQHLRYTLPFLPVLILGCIELARQVFVRIPPNARRVRACVRVLSFLAITVVLGERVLAWYESNTKLMRQAWAWSPEGKRVAFGQVAYKQEALALDEACDWIAMHAGQDDIVAGVVPQWIYLRTGRRAVMPPFGEEADSANRLLDTVPVRYLIREPSQYFTHRYTSRMVERHPDRWRLVFTASFDDARVYKRVD